MPDYETLYPGRFLKSKALERPRTIRIAGIKQEALKGDDGVKAKGVLKYAAARGETGEIVLALTNSILIAAALGERDFTKWIGRLVTIKNDPTVKFGNDVLGGIRVCGSPELKESIDVEVQPTRRRRAVTVTLYPTDNAGNVREASTGKQEAPPAQDDEPGTDS